MNATAEPRWLRALFLLPAVLAVAPIFRYPDFFPQPYDWRYFTTGIEVGRRSLAWFGQLPLWNPYACGGQVLLANPQSMVGSPIIMLMVLIFGTALGIKLALVVYYFCAFDGMFRLARSYDLSLPAALFSSGLFGFGGWLALHVSSGHANFAAASLFPYLWLCYRRARDEIAWAIPLGAVAALIICDGGTSTPAMATVLLATLAIIDVVKRRSPRPLLALVAGGACAAVFSAPRLLPALEFAIDHPRRQWETDAVMIWEMARNGYWWRGVAPVGGKRYWFHEYGWRLSYVTPPLIVWSLRVKKTRALWIVIAVGAGIVAGSAIPYGPWWLLKHLPLFRDLRVPSRYAVMFALTFPLLCGAAFDDLRARFADRRWLKGASIALIAVAAIDGAAFAWLSPGASGFDRGYFSTFTMNVQEASKGARFYHVKGDWRSMMQHVLVGHGAIGCDEEAPLQRAEALDEGDVPQVKLLEPDAGRVIDVRWTPNRIEADIELARPSTVLFNMNWNEHWKAEGGAIVKHGKKWPRDRDGGRLSIAADAGKRTVAAYYRPRSFVVGSATFLAGAPLLLAVFVWHSRRKRA